MAKRFYFLSASDYIEEAPDGRLFVIPHKEGEFEDFVDQQIAEMNACDDLEQVELYKRYGQ
jgi:hypothetical protein